MRLSIKLRTVILYNLLEMEGSQINQLEMIL
jgi:hypothetical protein